MRPSYGYGEALPYMRPAQGVVEPYYYTERYWPRPADTWGYCEGGPYEGGYPEWEEYYYGPHDSYAPPRYRGFRSPAYPFPPPPPPRAFTFAHRPFHPSDQFRHPDEYPMRFVPVPLGYDYAASPPRMQAVKQEPFREMPNDKHCCGCPNHICLKGDDSHEKRIDFKEAANGNSDDCKTKKQLQEYPVPVIWFPDGRKQFPLDFNSNKSDGNTADDKTKQELQEYAFPVVWFPDGRQQFLPYFNSNKSLEDDRKQNVDKNLQCGKLQPFPFFWVPAGFKPYKDDVDDNAKAKNFDQEKKISNEGISRSMPVEEPAKEMPKAREIPVKQILEEKPSNGGIFGSKSAEELGKEVRKVREIPVKQVLKENPSQALPAENREETKPSSPRSPRLPPVCLRVDPLPKKKVDGKNSSRSPSPSHKRTAVGTPAESVNKCEKNTQSNVSQVSPETKRGKIEETKSGKIEEQTNAQVKKSPEEGVCLRKKTRTMTEEEAAIIIQSFYRGYQIRRLQPLKKLREISKIKGRVNELNEQISNPELLLSLTRDPKAKGRFSETLMVLLLQLDTIQGLHPVVRDVRKSVARELVGLQEKLDQISVEFPQQIPTAVEAQEMKDDVSDDSTLNNYSENKQVDQETVNDEHLTKKQEAFFSSDLAREKPGVSPAEEAPNKEIVPSFTAEQATQAMDDAPETVTAKEGHDLAEAMVEVEHEMKQTIPAVYDAPDTVTAKEGDDDSAEAIVEGEQEKKQTIPAVNNAPGTVAGDEGHDFAEAMVEGEHENTLKIPAVNDAPETVEEGHDSAEAMVEGEHENKQTIPAVDSVTAEEGHDSAEAMVKVEHENEQTITAVEDAMDSVTADEGDDSAEAKVEAECENKHAIQSVDSVGENEGKNLAEAVAEIDHKNDDEKSSVVVCKDIVEAAELKSDPTGKAEGAELSTDGSISLAIEKEKPVECSVLSGVEEKKSVECSSKADKTEAAEAFNPSLDPTILSEEISTKSNELSTPSVEFSIKGQELVSRCDESSNLSIPGERCSVKCGDASNPAAEESEHVIDNHAIEAEIPRALEQPAVESEGERKPKSDLNENDDVRRKENWEEENERLKETVEKLMEAGKHQMSTIAELNDKIRYLESKLLNGIKGKGRRRARIGPMKVKNGVLFRRNAASDKP